MKKILNIPPYKKRTTTNMHLLYEDPCLWFKAMKQKNQNHGHDIFSLETLNHLYANLPTLSVRKDKQDQFPLNYTHMEKGIPSMKRQYHEKTNGKNSSIFRGLYNDEFVIFKTSTINTTLSHYHADSNSNSDIDISFLREILIQLELSIMLKSEQKNPQNLKRNSNFYADIPKIKFIFREKYLTSSSPKLFVVMEEIKGFTGRRFVMNSNNTEYYHKDIMDMVQQINSTVHYLQTSCCFMHRDLHLSNVMFSCTEPHKHTIEEFEDSESSFFVCRHPKQWYIYDFEWCILKTPRDKQKNHISKDKTKTKTNRKTYQTLKKKITLSYNKRWINQYTNYPYEKIHTFNPSHDMRIFIFSLFTTLYRKFLNIYQKEEKNKPSEITHTTVKYRHLPIPILLITMCFIWNTHSYLQEFHNVFFWNVYGDVVQKQDNTFNPKTIQKYFKIEPLYLKNLIKTIDCKKIKKTMNHSCFFNTICSKWSFIQSELFDKTK